MQPKQTFRRPGKPSTAADSLRICLFGFCINAVCPGTCFALKYKALRSEARPAMHDPFYTRRRLQTGLLWLTLMPTWLPMLMPTLPPNLHPNVQADCPPQNFSKTEIGLL
jgi:hypothetical protein